MPSRSASTADSLPPAAPVGVVGLGLMGRDITTCLLAHGYEVIAYDRDPGRSSSASAHIGRALQGMVRKKIVPATAIAQWKQRFRLAAGLAEFAPCFFVIESAVEDLPLKRGIFEELETHLRKTAVIASNTSSIPISTLQSARRHPQRFIGMHWAEPAQITHYLEIIPGAETSPATIRKTRELGLHCGKQPTVLRRDIRGFLSNRLMYAMLREACYLVESGVADMETIDQSFRNDIGWWATFAGPFRWMDLTGIPAYVAVMQELLPNLNTATDVPPLMLRMLAQGARGISNAKGFYPYTPESAAQWEKDWVEFTYDVRKLAEKYKR